MLWLVDWVKTGGHTGGVGDAVAVAVGVGAVQLPNRIETLFEFWLAVAKS